MSEQYRLVFSAEVVEGQHPAVVKKRLGAVLKLDDERMDVLFSGKSVVVKKATDEKTAARYQEAFKKAGARLRVLPIEADDPLRAAAESAPQAPSAPEASAPAGSKEPAVAGKEPASPDDLSVLPIGADVLTDAERVDQVAAEVDTSHLSVQGAVFPVDEPEAAIDVPNVDHLTLAELGARLGQGDAQEVVVAEIDVEFDLAEVGAILGVLDAQPPAAPVDVDSVDFELAETGADMDTTDKPRPPPPPDTSHLSLDDD